MTNEMNMHIDPITDTDIAEMTLQISATGTDISALKIRGKVEFLDNLFDAEISGLITDDSNGQYKLTIPFDHPPLIDYLKDLPEDIMDFPFYFTLSVEVYANGGEVVHQQSELIENPWFNKSTTKFESSEFRTGETSHLDMEKIKDLLAEAIEAETGGEIMVTASEYPTSFSIRALANNTTYELCFTEGFIWVKKDMSLLEKTISRLMKYRLPGYYIEEYNNTDEDYFYDSLVKLMTTGECTVENFRQVIQNLHLLSD